MKTKYLIRSVSPCPIDQVYLIYDPVLDQRLTATELENAKSRWNEINRDRITANKPPLQDCPLFLPGHEIRLENRIDIPCGRTSYMSTIVRSAFCPDWNSVCTGAGLSIVPVCADGMILIGRRSGIVNEGKHLFHVAAGHAHPRPDFTSRPDKLTGAVLQELEEEMGVRPGDIEKTLFLGIGLNRFTAKTEFLTCVVLKEDARYYTRQWMAAIRCQKQPEFEEMSTLEKIIGADSFEVHRNRFTVACQMALEAHQRG